MVVSLTKGYHMEHPNVHLTPQKTYIQQDVHEIIQPSSMFGFCQSQHKVVLTFYHSQPFLSNKVIGKVRDTLWGQGGKSLPLSEFSIFGHIWV